MEANPEADLTRQTQRKNREESIFDLQKSKIMAEAPIRYNGKKLGSIPRTPTLKVLAAQQDLAFCFVYVKCADTTV